MKSMGHLDLAPQSVLRVGVALLVVCGCGQRADRSKPRATESPLPVVDRERPLAVVASAPNADRGPVLYAQHCAACHGEKGDGQGPVSYTHLTLPTKRIV